MAANRMLDKLRRTRLIDLGLNFVFGAWVLYVTATGSIVPGPLLRDAPRAPTVEVQRDSPPLMPVDVVEEES